MESCPKKWKVQSYFDFARNPASWGNLGERHLAVARPQGWKPAIAWSYGSKFRE
jgi:hypothetical protein